MLDDDSCYLAIRSRDARFDGCFFTAVTSTGIYCRPVCRVRAPQRAHCRFFEHPAQAEAAGFRPCLRCRPECAPGLHAWSPTDAGKQLMAQATQWLRHDVCQADGTPWSAAGLSQKLGISDRHLRRLFTMHWGVSPQQAILTQRLLTAKAWLSDTRLSVEDVAARSGFGSARRLRACMSERYGLAPSRWRQPANAAQPQLTRSAASLASASSDSVTLHLAYRPPIAWDALTDFIVQRHVAGLEWTLPARAAAASAQQHQGLGRTLRMGPDAAGWIEVRLVPARHQVALTLSASLIAHLHAVQMRVRSWLDLDCHPDAVTSVLESLLTPSWPHGLRLPGTTDGWELAVRAILGQQVTVAAGRQLVERMVTQWGEHIPGPKGRAVRLFPQAQAVAGLLPSDLGALGIIRQRQVALLTLAKIVAQGGLNLSPGADVQATLSLLRQIPGIGPWTSQYIAMRALHWPDALPSGDAVLRKAWATPRPAEMDEFANRFRPWRSYATLHTWNTAAHAPPLHS
jgi:AraC family transcriptional regulator, regulatory protein of adaptative response / DNA-3-methyladenine glycosylase II